MPEEAVDNETWVTLHDACFEQLYGKMSGLKEAFNVDGFSVVHANRTVLKGTYHHEAAEYVYEGEVLRCLPEPKNRHDKKAIMVVDREGQKVGYLASDSAYREKVRAAIDSGHEVYAITIESTVDEEYGRIHVLLVQRD